MPIIAKETGGGPKELPAVDVHNAVCAFVEDLGLQPGYQGGAAKHKIVLIWELEQKMSDGRPFMLSKKYTLSLHEKSALRHDLESWRGRPFSAEELAGFDVEVLRGVNCRLNVTHTPKTEGGMRAQVQSVIKAAQGFKLIPEATTPPEWVNETRSKALVATQQESVPDWGAPGHTEEPIPF